MKLYVNTLSFLYQKTLQNKSLLRKVRIYFYFNTNNLNSIFIKNNYNYRHFIYTFIRYLVLPNPND